ncbi:MAG: hypothetical protein R2861_15475 [Desulfobacterales bacterium]
MKARAVEGPYRQDSNRGIFAAAENGFLVFKITANGFLRYMVRNLAGTLVEVGLGKRTAEKIQADSGREKPGSGRPTAPPRGGCF